MLPSTADGDRSGIIEGRWEACEEVAAMEMMEDLAAAWKICVKQTKKAFPVSQRMPGAPGKAWPELASGHGLQ